MDFITFFLLLAGFSIGLGAVTVIDLHGFFGQKSSYWTEATIRTHKITKPLIWIGTGLILCAQILGNYTGLFKELFFHFYILAALILNGCFLTFVVSRELLTREKNGRATELLPGSLQRKIILSFCISFIGWWTLVISFAYFLSNSVVY